MSLTPHQEAVKLFDDVIRDAMTTYCKTHSCSTCKFGINEDNPDYNPLPIRSIEVNCYARRLREKLYNILVGEYEHDNR